MYNSFVEIGHDHFLFGLGGSVDLVIVKEWNVVERITGQDSGNIETVLIELRSFFDINSFPFVISKGSQTIQLINVQSGTTQTLIKSQTVEQYAIGFCLPMPDQEFEFHFTNSTEAEAEGDNLYHANYYKMPFKKDLISVMKRCGGIPESSMDSYVSTIEERNSLKKKAKEQDELLAKANEEIARLRSAAL